MTKVKVRKPSHIGEGRSFTNWESRRLREMGLGSESSAESIIEALDEIRATAPDAVIPAHQVRSLQYRTDTGIVNIEVASTVVGESLDELIEFLLTHAGLQRIAVVEVGGWTFCGPILDLRIGEGMSADCSFTIGPDYESQRKT